MALTKQQKVVRDAAMDDLYLFAKLVGPTQLYGRIHEDCFNWYQAPERKDDTLLLLPRDHRKSHVVAVKPAWLATKDPTITVLYMSATTGLAMQQLHAIKSILTSPIYMKYWPDMVHQEEGKRAKWTTEQIILDHPSIKENLIVNPTIRVGSISTNVTGFHCTHQVLDDLVVPANAYTKGGRESVAASFSQLASILSPDGTTDTVGTRYHPLDLYHDLLNMKEKVYDEETDEVVKQEEVYDIKQHVVETDGEFLWPRMKRDDGAMFGFDRKQLARKEAKYKDKAQFYAQYYNNPNDPTSNKIDKSVIQYYDRKNLVQEDGIWYLNGKNLRIFAGIDFAFSLSKRADYTAIAVIGMDSDRNIFILELDRFKTNSIQVYFEHLNELWHKWHFKVLRAEVTVAQQTIVTQIKEVWFPQNGILCKIDEYRPSRHEGTKEERIDATLEPRYQAKTMYHYRGGVCTDLEEELKLKRPPHDDLKDALTAAVDIAVPPINLGSNWINKRNKAQSNVINTNRFGGRR